MLAEIWAAVGGDPGLLDAVSVDGPRVVLPSAYDVTGLAAATTAAAGLGAAAALAARTGSPVRGVSVDRRAAAAAFVSERLFAPVGWALPDPWDPIAGDYLAADGWIRLHTNYAYHRAAVERVLGAVGDRAGVADRVRGWASADLENAVVDAGGCAAAMHDAATWAASPQGSAGEPLARIARSHAPGPARAGAVAAQTGGRVFGAGELAEADSALPFAGVRVLDLTRVIAGPVATRTLAAFGAKVLRVDPPGFAEVPALIPDMTVGKRCAALDLRSPAGRAAFDRLLADADVLVCGLRPGALDGLGVDVPPHLIVAHLDAYGWDGPWRGRRGFDSLVQMSCGIAATGMSLSGGDRPVPLPAQALDHGTGYLLAAAIGVALARRHTHGEATTVRASLIGTANALLARPTPDDLTLDPPVWTDADTVPASTTWGPARRVPLPVRVDEVPAGWPVSAGPLGRDPAAWA